MSKFKRPTAIIAISVFYILSPICNFALGALIAELSLGEFLDKAADLYGSFGFALVLVAPIIGAGIFWGRKWGYVLFLAHSAAILANNTMLLASSARQSTGMLLAVDVAIFFLVGSMLTKDLRAPYLAKEERGWRTKRRMPVNIPVKVTIQGEEREGTAANLSHGGAFVRCPTAGVTLTEGVKLAFLLGSDPVQVDATVARVEPDGLGVAFREGSSELVKTIWERMSKS